MLSLVRYPREVEIAACGMSSDFSSCRAGSTWPKAVAEFDMFDIGEGIASGKHVAQTADQSAPTDEKVD